MTDEREIHAPHPARPHQTLCGVLGGTGCRMEVGPPITCEACRAVIEFCRETVQLGDSEDI